MFKNYFHVAVRNILKHKFFSAINILGMTIGVCACLLVILYVADELSFDRFHQNADRIYQVGLHGKMGGQEARTANTCPPLAAAMMMDIPEVEEVMRIAPYFGQPPVRFGDKIFTEDRVYFADSNFFRFFSYRLLEGDARTALKGPDNVVMTTEMVKKYFGNDDPIGKLISIGDENRTYKVTGVCENSPANSHFRYNILISSESSDNLKRDIFLNNFMYTYYRLRPNVSLSKMNDGFERVVRKYVGPEFERIMGMDMKKMREGGGEYGYFSTALTDLRLHSTTTDSISEQGNVLYVYFFGAIGVFIIVIACINFMNLSTARSAGRAKEVGLRKTLGSLRGQMILQFLTESIIYSLVAVTIALAATYFVLPYFNLLSGKELQIEVLGSPLIVSSIIGLILFVGLIAGCYPAFYLTSFSAVEVLKGKVRSGMRTKGIRSTLVIFQFGLSIFLIIFTTVVYRQIQFMQHQKLGLDKNNVLVIRSTGRLGTKKDAFRNALRQHPGVSHISYSNNYFPGVNNTTLFRSAGDEQDHIMGTYVADEEHLEVMKFELTAGRFFSKDFPGDTSAIVLNEAAVKEFGFKDPVGEEVIFPDGRTLNRYKVIGVLKNFNFESFKTQVRPLTVRYAQDANNMQLRYSGSPKELVAGVEKTWKQFAPGAPFEYVFLDDSFDELYRAELRMGNIFTVFSGLAIFIASLGLFALAAFSAEQRTKEIGIRKAMGASVFSLIMLLSREFTRLVLFAFVPAAAAGWYVSNEWLSGFQYRVAVEPIVLLASGLGALVLAWLTVSYQSIKTARTNPVNSLRYE